MLKKHKSIYVEFGRRLKEARNLKGLNQSELAKLMGVSRVTITNIEAGRQNVSLVQVLSLIRELTFFLPEELAIPFDWTKLDKIREARVRLEAARIGYREAQKK